MNQWLHTFLTEKQVDQQITFVFEVAGETHYVPFEVVLEFIEHLPESLQQQIKEKLIGIDFRNGNVLRFFEYLAKGMVRLT